MSFNKRRKWDARRVHYVRAVLMSLSSSLIWTVMMIYQIQVVGLTPLQLVLIGTTMETTVFLFEVPTGIVADLVSRRLSCIIGFFLMGAAFLLQGGIASFAALVVGNIIWGIGFTFTSGAYDAWLTDEIGADKLGVALLRAGQLERLLSIGGIVVATILGGIALQIPILIGACLCLATAVFLLLFMPETGFQPAPRTDRGSFQKMWDTFREGVKVIRVRPALISILGVAFFLGLFSEGWDRLWQAQLINTYQIEQVTGIAPLVWVSGLSITVMLIGTGINEFVIRRLDMTNSRRLTQVLFGIVALMIIGMVVYGLGVSLVVGLAAYFVFVLARELVDPLLTTWTNQKIPSAVRATVLSMRSQTDAIGQIAGGPPVGVLGNVSLQLALVVSGLILSPALVLLARMLRREPALDVES